MCHPVIRPVAFACLVLASAACQPQRPAFQAGMAHAVAQEASPIGRNPVAYFGELFSKEEEALAAKPSESVAPPTF